MDWTDGGGGLCAPTNQTMSLLTHLQFHIAQKSELFLDYDFLDYQEKATMT